MRTPLDEHIIDLLEQHGEMHSRDILASKPEVSPNTFRKRIAKLKNDGVIAMPKKSVYILASTSETQTSPNQQHKQISNALRSADDNKNTIDKLMNLYDKHIDRYAQWFDKSVDDDTDFEDELQFIENFKGLTAIGDKLMKRWALEHVGYDTNSRQAQEDAKAKTAEREKAALEDAPLSDRVMIIGKYDPEAEELLDCIPSSLEKMTREEQEKAKV